MSLGALILLMIILPVMVSLQPPAIVAKAGDEIVVEVFVDPRSHGVSSGELNVTFPVNVLEAVSIEPGPLLGAEQLTIIQEVNNEKGYCFLVTARIGETPVPTMPGVFATIRFKVKANARPGQYFIRVEWLYLADENFEDLNTTIVNDVLVYVFKPPTITFRETITHTKTKTTTTTSTIVKTETYTTTETKTLEKTIVKTTTLERTVTTTSPVTKIVTTTSTTTVEKPTIEPITTGVLIVIIVALAVALALTYRKARKT